MLDPSCLVGCDLKTCIYSGNIVTWNSEHIGVRAGEGGGRDNTARGMCPLDHPGLLYSMVGGPTCHLIGSVSNQGG